MARTSVASKNLLRDRTRLAISVGGVAIAVLLILVVRGLYAGFLDQATEYSREVGVDVWVVDAGSSGDLFHSISLQPRERGAAIAEVEGVQAVAPLLARSVTMQHEERGVELFVIGVDEGGVGGPSTLQEGRQIAGSGELVIDRVFAAEEDVGVGDSLVVDDRSWQVVGIARGGNAFIAQLVWTSFEDVAALFGVGDIVNYFLVHSGDGVDPAALTERIRSEVPGTNPLTAAQFERANTEEISEGFLPIIWVLVIIAFAVGSTVIALTIYTSTIEKRAEFGVLKAIGFSNRRLFGIVCRQALVAGAAGLVVGTGATFLLAALLERAMPSFVVYLRAVDILFVGVVALAMSIAASIVPVRPIARMDPAEVFRV